MVKKLSDDSLLRGFQRAVTFAAGEAVRKFGPEIVDRPSFAGRDERLQALMVLARTEEDWEQARQYLEQGRQAARTAGKSCAVWDLEELPGDLVRGDAERAIALIDHVSRQHGREPGVREALVEMLARLGVLRPDGTVAVPSARPRPETAEQPAIGAPAETPKLWTPGGETPTGKRSALWTPDMG
jgi:hypothetical protein